MFIYVECIVQVGKSKSRPPLVIAILGRNSPRKYSSLPGEPTENWSEKYFFSMNITTTVQSISSDHRRRRRKNNDVTWTDDDICVRTVSSSSCQSLTCPTVTKYVRPDAKSTYGLAKINTAAQLRHFSIRPSAQYTKIPFLWSDDPRYKFSSKPLLEGKSQKAKSKGRKEPL